MTVLIIAYYFPPAGGGGVQRIAKFVKYLSRAGVNCIIITAEGDDYVETDDSLLLELEHVTIIRISSPLSKKKTNEIRTIQAVNLPWQDSDCKSIKGALIKFLRTFILIPDSQIFWTGMVILRVRRILKEYNPNAIMVTGPPFSSYLAAYVSKKNHRKPVILDYRDPWTQLFHSYRKNENWLRKKLEYFLEKRITQNADYIIGTTNIILEYFSSEGFQINKNRLKLIYNGFDPEDFLDVKAKEFDTFSIVYTGKVTPFEYSALPFLKAFHVFVDRFKVSPNDIRIFFLGAFDDPDSYNYLEDHNLSSYVEIMGYQPHNRILAYQAGADILLLTLREGFTDKYIILGKLFEYLKHKRPILAMIPEESPMNNILIDYPLAAVSRTDDLESIVVAISRLFNEGNPYNELPTSSLNGFNRENQAKQLLTLLESLN